MILQRLKNDNTPELKLNRLQSKMKVQVSRKVDTEVYQFEEIVCPICESSNKELIGEKDRYGLFYSTNICTECGLVYTSPRMTQTSYNEFYNIEYRKLYVGEEKATLSFFTSQRQKGERIYNFLKKNKLVIDQPLFVLEIGCGAGGILDFFKGKGHKVKGIDLGKEYVEYGKEVYGLDLDVGILSEYQFKEKPDIVIYSHVLEHILDLNWELQAIKRIITEDTVVYIEVPGIKEIHQNYEANILKYFQNAHTFHFTLETLTNLFRKNGLELLFGNQFIQSVFKLSNNVASQKNDYVDTRTYIISIEKRRRLYPFTSIGLKRNFKKLTLKLLDITKTRSFAKSIKLWLTK